MKFYWYLVVLATLVALSGWVLGEAYFVGAALVVAFYGVFQYEKSKRGRKFAGTNRRRRGH